MQTILRHASPENSENWEAYHAIRRSVLWDGGQRYWYRTDHPDETAEGHYPMVFFVSETPVGVVRIDIDKKKEQAKFCRLLVAIPERRKGYGTLMVEAAEQFARQNGCDIFVVNAPLDVVPFYSRQGYSLDPGKHGNAQQNPRMTKLATSAKPGIFRPKDPQALPRLSLRLPKSFGAR